MTVKERLHRLIDEMHEDQAYGLLMDLEQPLPPLTAEDRASIERGFADSRAGRTKPHAEIVAKYGPKD
jgi:predicted transcriptional regulator